MPILLLQLLIIILYMPREESKPKRNEMKNKT